MVLGRITDLGITKYNMQCIFLTDMIQADSHIFKNSQYGSTKNKLLVPLMLNKNLLLIFTYIEKKLSGVLAFVCGSLGGWRPVGKQVNHCCMVRLL